MPSTRAPKKLSTASRARKVTPSSMPIHSAPNVCTSCHALPAGSMELMALMLVLVFSLTAVLFTSIYSMQIQSAKLQAAEAQLSLEY